MCLGRRVTAHAEKRIDTEFVRTDRPMDRDGLCLFVLSQCIEITRRE